MGEESKVVPLTHDQLEYLESAVSRYSHALNTDAHATHYLGRRGFNQRIAEDFRLGVVCDALPGHERFEGMLAIPYLGRGDVPLSIRFRCIEDHSCKELKHGKYNGMSGEVGRMFNVRAIFKAKDSINLCEGEIDTMILNMLGMPAIGMPGATTFRPRHRKMLAGFSRIHIWADPDEAGHAFANKVGQALPQARTVRLIDGDVNETYLRHGAKGIKELIKQ